MTIRHLVLFHLLDGIDAHDPRVSAAVAVEQELARAIPGDHGWVFGRDVSRRPVSADFAGTGDFGSAEELAAFLAHPAHAAAGEAWSGLVRLTVADIEVAS